MSVRDLNSVVIIGRLVQKPELKYTTNGIPIAKFSIANNTSYMQNNERKNYVNYFDLTVWGNQAINCEKYLKKGSLVAVEGHLRQNRWTDPTTNKTLSKVEIIANSVQFLTPVSSNAETISQFQNKVSSNSKQQENGNINNPFDDIGNSNGIEDSYDPGFSDDTFNGGDDDIPF
ncbi:MAG TPA: single-stranded DNA-binding protein [Spirochaetota bacterium]|nr:single-stranded DNA-binding protein [Spirochaetota bacterium]HOL56394.1 single-stranded DNA-binding protein [Spirochaetota bacterium]HPP05277.1 single-stranded DNA-binding protein [Spirochaetota bacterium]